MRSKEDIAREEAFAEARKIGYLKVKGTSKRSRNWCSEWHELCGKEGRPVAFIQTRQTTARVFIDTIVMVSESSFVCLGDTGLFSWERMPIERAEPVVQLALKRLAALVEEHGGRWSEM